MQKEIIRKRIMQKKIIRTFYDVYPLIIAAIILAIFIPACISADAHRDDEARCDSLGGIYTGDKCYVNGVEK